MLCLPLCPQQLTSPLLSKNKRASIGSSLNFLLLDLQIWKHLQLSSPLSSSYSGENSFPWAMNPTVHIFRNLIIIIILSASFSLVSWLILTDAYLFFFSDVENIVSTALSCIVELLILISSWLAINNFTISSFNPKPVPLQPEGPEPICLITHTFSSLYTCKIYHTVVLEFYASDQNQKDIIRWIWKY